MQEMGLQDSIVAVARPVPANGRPVMARRVLCVLMPVLFLLSACSEPKKAERGRPSVPPTKNGDSPEDPAPPPVPGKRPDIELVVRTDKSDYVQLEPIRFIAFIANAGDQDVEVVLGSGHGYPVEITFYRVTPDGGLEKLGVKGLEELRHHGPPAVSFKKDDDFIGRYWQDNLFAPGPVRIRAVMRLTSPSYKGIEYESDEVEVRVTTPTGADAQAHAFITSRALVRLPGALQAADYGSVGLVFNSGSHHGRSMHEYFVKHHGSSIHSFYTRYTMGRYIGIPDNRRLMREVVDSAPRDFPLRGECYVQLLEYHKSLSELAEMAALSRRIEKESPRVLDPMVARQLARLAKEIEWWPPDTPEEEAKASKARHAVTARKFAGAHWLVASLAKSYGRGRQPQYAPGYTEMWFYDPRQAWGLRVKYHVDGRGSLEKLVFHGGLESFRVGKLAGVVTGLRKKHGLSEDEGLKTFVMATIEGDSASGYLQLPGGKRVGFSAGLDASRSADSK